MKNLIELAPHEDGTSRARGAGPRTRRGPSLGAGAHSGHVKERQAKEGAHGNANGQHANHDLDLAAP